MLTWLWLPMKISALQLYLISRSNKNLSRQILKVSTALIETTKSGEYFHTETIQFVKLNLHISSHIRNWYILICDFSNKPVHAFYMLAGDLFPSVLWHCWLGNRNSIRACKNFGVGLLVVMIWLQLCTSHSSSSYHHLHHP